MSRNRNPIFLWSLVVLAGAALSLGRSQRIPDLTHVPERIAIAAGIAILVGLCVASDLSQRRGRDPSRADTRLAVAGAFGAAQLLVIAGSRLGIPIPFERPLEVLILIVGAFGLSIADFFDPTRTRLHDMTPLTAFVATIFVGVFWITATRLVAVPAHALRRLRDARVRRRA